MSLLLRRIWKLLQLMIGNAKEPSRKGAGVSSPYPHISCLDQYWVLKSFLVEYLKMASPCFNLHVFDYDWGGYFSVTSYRRFLRCECSVLTQEDFLNRVSQLFLCYLAPTNWDISPAGHRDLADSRTTPGIQIILRKQYLVLWLMKDLAIYIEINHWQMELCQPMK